MERGLAAVQVLDDLGDTAVVLELQALGLAGLGICLPFIGERDLQAFVQEGQLAQTLGQGVKVVFRDGEDLFVGQEVDLRAALFGGPGLAQLTLRLALGIPLLPHMAIAPYLQVQLVAERVHAGDADAVQTAGDFVV